MAKNHAKMAEEILKYVGGEENVKSLAHCMTRLRFALKDESKVNVAALKKVEGVIQVVVVGGQHQVIIGADVGDVYTEIGKIADINLAGEEADAAGKKSPLNIMIDIISAIFLPFMGAFMGAGLLKGFLVVFTSLGWMSAEGTTYALLYAMADGVFTFLPVFLAYTSAKKFGAEPFVAMAVAAALVYPNISALFNAGAEVTFAGIPVTLISYPSSVIPIIVAVFCQAKLEKLLKPLFPQIIRGIFVPLISLIVISLLTFMVIGPVTDIVASALAGGISFLLEVCPPLAGGLFGLIYPVMLIFGLHWGLVPLVMNNFATLGYDTIFPITLATNFALAGCALGVFLKTRNKEMKQISGSTFVSAFLAGVTEPAIYGVVLKFKKPFVIVCLLDAIGGVIIAMAGSVQTAMISTNIITVPAIIAMMGTASVPVILLGLVGGTVLTYLVGFSDKMLEVQE